MIATISIEKAQERMEKALKDYAARNKNLIDFSIEAGIVVGTFLLLYEMEGFPEEKIEEYRLRIEGIGELNVIRSTNNA